MRTTNALRQAITLTAVLAALGLSAQAQALPPVKLTATLTPERLGHGTTIGFSFRVGTSAGTIPSPLSRINVSYPENIGIGLSGIGIAACSAQTLELSGAKACPDNSIMGYGSTLAEIRIGPELVKEVTPITIVRGPDQDGHLALLFNATSPLPVDAQIVAPGLLLPAEAPFGGSVAITVPPVPSIPGAPDIAIVQLRATLGPQGVTYYEQVGGNTLAYQPKGFLLPDRCPHGGFPFAADLTFQDGSEIAAKTAVPCPGQKKHKARKRP